MAESKIEGIDDKYVAEAEQALKAALERIGEIADIKSADGSRDIGKIYAENNPVGRGYLASPAVRDLASDVARELGLGQDFAKIYRNELTTGRDSVGLFGIEIPLESHASGGIDVEEAAEVLRESAGIYYEKNGIEFEVSEDVAGGDPDLALLVALKANALQEADRDKEHEIKREEPVVRASASRNAPVSVEKSGDKVDPVMVASLADNSELNNLFDSMGPLGEFFKMFFDFFGGSELFKNIADAPSAVEAVEALPDVAGLEAAKVGAAEAAQDVLPEVWVEWVDKFKSFLGEDVDASNDAAPVGGITQYNTIPGKWPAALVESAIRDAVGDGSSVLSSNGEEDGVFASAAKGDNAVRVVDPTQNPVIPPQVAPVNATDPALDGSKQEALLVPGGQ